MQGADLLKHGRLGKPKMHFFRLAEADTHLTWRSSNGKQRSIALATVFQVGLETCMWGLYHCLRHLICRSYGVLIERAEHSH